jgi:predicted ATPase/DNA-binding SARP family transcriptional activator/DNA-binding CsgD family transcriptional regulator
MRPQSGVRGTAPIDGHSGGDREPVRVRLLGGFGVSIGARTIGEDEWRLKKAGDLVKLLALTPDHRMHRERIMHLLWPELGPKPAANNLRQALHAARRVLDSVGSTAASSRYVRLGGEQLALCPDGHLWVDVEAFEAAAVAARRSRDPAAYRAALNLYAGELLPEDRYEDWAENRRTELGQSYLALLVEMAELCEKLGDLESAIDAFRQVVSEEPAHEEAHAGLMRLYARSGQRYQSLRQYEQLREALQRRFGTEPGVASRSLHEKIVAGRFPIARSPSPQEVSQRPQDSHQHNIPAALSSFVGREREMVEVERALAMTRLLTLTGVGGSGKTRLALEVARGLAGTYPEGAWLAELAPLSNPELLPQAVAAALGVRERSEDSGQSFTLSLIDALRSKNLLLVLDNCEHLVGPCAHLAEGLLGSCPGVRVLATSREALGVAGEAVWVVPPLSVPDPRRPTTPEETATSGSVLLFLDRARSRRPAFVLTPQNAPAVAEICRRLDGIPLAIELAAARVATMSVEEIAVRLGNSLGLLTTGNRTATPRQRTLRATLGWSHDLLGEPERSLFASLSVFVGGFSLEAAEAVSQRVGIEEGKVLDLLSALVDKSLVVAEATGEEEVRYGMLEPVRQYARERLEESGGTDDLLSRHAAYFLAEAETAEPELVGSQQGWWLSRLDREHGNLRAALAWSLERGDELGLRLGVALSRFWYARGYLSEGRRWLEEGLSVVGDTASALVRAKALGEAGALADYQGDFEQARVAHEASLDIYRGLGNERGIATSLRNLGSVAASQGHYGRATELLGESLTLLRQSGTDTDVVRVLIRLGTLAISRGEHERSVAWFEEALSLARKTGDVIMVAVSLNNLGHVTLLRGDPERATALFEECLAREREVGEAHGIAISLINLGLAALARGDHGRATELLLESLTVLREVESKQIMVAWLEVMAGVAGGRGQAQRTARLWGAAQSFREDMGAPLPSDELAMLEPYLTIARSLVGEKAWEIARTEGRAMTYERAIEYALSEEEPDPHVIPTPKRRQAVGARSEVLTRREEEVAALVARGLSNLQIASDLHLSERTVEHHVSKILRKLLLTSRTEIASWSTQQRLTAPNSD